MKRHFTNPVLFNRDPTQRFVPSQLSIWQLPPYVVANFCGELTRVMLEAAETYIAERSRIQILKEFDQAAFQGKTPPKQHFSAASNNNVS